MFEFPAPSLKDIDALNSLTLNVINRDIFLREGVKIRLLSVHFNHQQKKHKIEEHEHATFEMSIPLCGGMTTWADGKKIINDAQSPSILLLPPGMLHHRIFSETGETINLSWVFNIEFEKKDQKISLSMNNYAKQICQQKDFNLAISPLCYDLLKTFFTAFYKRAAGLSALAAELFKTFLVLVLQEELPGIFQSNSEFQSETDLYIDREKIIKKACVFVMSNNNICHELAADMGISVRHLNRIFYEKNGISINQYRNNLRFNHACELLNSTDMKISEIGNVIGFKNPVSFNAFFKKHSGFSPQKMRDNRSLNNKKFH